MNSHISDEHVVFFFAALSSFTTESSTSNGQSWKYIYGVVCGSLSCFLLHSQC